ncbi:DNA-binding transcriptional regulator, AcrR family [Amycolatopsis arida]|uniref:DNA-binding transcriptional regulator, AcrR family n=1 Tax=Amycolatopsis arida TaxID=587909 RepID=A0A1I5XVQ1_9PSEU|nr:TetR/AcrR family transcriptional regulator [Amycolatopsis arida]TDX97236.1 AcrR family transcriptional regulator [Amycolatopsis arida]SFQ36039.1 DNA-binding transcriptional regulator, AcrR family [Amycolatopsis arida]
MSERAGRILTAAAELFLRFGVAKTTVDDIARAAGVSKGSVYLEFRGKDELFEALVKAEVRGYLDAVLGRVEGDPEGGRLGRIYRHAIDELLARPLLMALYTRDADLLGAMVRRHGAARYAPRFPLGREFVERLQAAGLVRPDVDPGALSDAMAVVSVGLVMAPPLHGDGRNWPLPGTVDLLATMVTEVAEPPDAGGADQAAVAAGKAAFAALCRRLAEEIAS